MSISARTRRSTWSTDAPESVDGLGRLICGGARRRAYCSFLGEARNFARLGIRREVAARRPISKARPISAAPHPAARKSRSAASKFPPCGEVGRSHSHNPRRSLLRLAETSRALSFKLHANPRPRLQIAPRERFQTFVAKVWSVGLALARIGIRREKPDLSPRYRRGSPGPPACQRLLGDRGRP
jgi:hypothetical protein